MAPMKRPTDTDRSSMSRERRPCPILQVPATLHRCIIEFSCDADQVLREVRVNPPVAHSIRVGHRVAGDSLAAKAQMIKFGGLRFKTGFDVSQAFTPCQLRERKTAI